MTSQAVLDYLDDNKLQRITVLIHNRFRHTSGLVKPKFTKFSLLFMTSENEFFNTIIDGSFVSIIYKYRELFPGSAEGETDL